MGQPKHHNMVELPSERNKKGLTLKQLRKRLPRVGSRMRKLPHWMTDYADKKERIKREPLWCEVISVNSKHCTYTVEYTGIHQRETFHALE